MNMWPDDCDTELCLSPGGLWYNRASRRDVSTGSSRVVERRREKLPQQQVKEGGGGGEEERPITFFYGDQMCTCDVTEIQARAIICTAKREMEEMAKKEEHFRRDRRDPHPAPPQTTSSSPVVPPQPLSEGLSVKRSLQWFLQKRKSRFCDESSICSNYYRHDRDHHHDHC
uniref:Uncharacterized protein n=1 Tax=Ananas comosus var. bracteatus TaxID=296719 RepID=A0A6V7PML8_ANACO|nr:unnamed protein product [Ananas comosus var. bracteatus]